MQTLHFNMQTPKFLDGRSLLYAREAALATSLALVIGPNTTRIQFWGMLLLYYTPHAWALSTVCIIASLAVRNLDVRLEVSAARNLENTSRCIVRQLFDLNRREIVDEYSSDER